MSNVFAEHWKYVVSSDQRHACTRPFRNDARLGVLASMSSFQSDQRNHRANSKSAGRPEVLPQKVRGQQQHIAEKGWYFEEPKAKQRRKEHSNTSLLLRLCVKRRKKRESNQKKVAKRIK